MIPISAVKFRTRGSDDLFLLRIPSHGTLKPMAFDRHAARDRDAVTKLERAVRLRGAGFDLRFDPRFDGWGSTDQGAGGRYCHGTDVSVG